MAWANDLVMLNLLKPHCKNHKHGCAASELQFWSPEWHHNSKDQIAKKYGWEDIFNGRQPNSALLAPQVTWLQVKGWTTTWVQPRTRTVDHTKGWHIHYVCVCVCVRVGNGHPTINNYIYKTYKNPSAFQTKPLGSWIGCGCLNRYGVAYNMIPYWRTFRTAKNCLIHG